MEGKKKERSRYGGMILYVALYLSLNLTVFLFVSVKPEYMRISRDDGLEISNSSLLGPLNEGHRLTLVCESGGGKPVPLVEWWNGNTKITGESAICLFFDPVRLSSCELYTLIKNSD